MLPFDSSYTQVVFNLICVQVCNILTIVASHDGKFTLGHHQE